MYMKIKNGTNTKAYHLTESHEKPYIVVKNKGVLPLTTNTTQGLQMKVKINNVTYRPLEYKTASSENTYSLSKLDSQGLSSTTGLTKISTASIRYGTQYSTTNTRYGVSTYNDTLTFRTYKYKLTAISKASLCSNEKILYTSQKITGTNIKKLYRINNYCYRVISGRIDGKNYSSYITISAKNIISTADYLYSTATNTDRMYSTTATFYDTVVSTTATIYDTVATTTAYAGVSKSTYSIKTWL